MGHSRLSPSSAHRWSRCPGSVKAEEGYENTSSPNAIDGTRTHAVCEYALLHDHGLHVGSEFTDTENNDTFVLDQERLDRVQQYVDYVDRRIAHLEEDQGEDCQMLVEKRVDAGTLIGAEGVSGTADCVLICGDTVEVIDYKDGHGIVEANDNDQMMLYALGALEMIRTPFDIPIKVVMMTIVQPKTIPPIKVAAYPLEEVLRRGDELAEAARATQQDNPVRVAGKKQCHWCLAKGNCEEQQLQALQETQVLFEGVDFESTDSVKVIADSVRQATPIQVGELSDEDLSSLLKATPLITAALANASAEADRRANEGGLIPDFKLVSGRGSRKWSLKDEELHEYLRKEVKLKESEIYTKKLISPAQAEKLKVSKGKLAKLSELVVKQKGKPSLVPSSDKREEIVVNADQLFNSVVTDLT